MDVLNLNPRFSKQVEPSLKVILDDPENKLLLLALERFAEILRRYGHIVSIYSSGSLLKLSDTTSEKKTAIRTFFENLADWMEPEAGSPEIIKVDLEKEKTFLRRAFSHHGLWMHEDFWNTLTEGQVIEFYGTDGVQLYRNINFFDFCSYSLLDISVFEWYNLWQRPSQIQEQMNRDAVKVFSTATPVMQYKVPRHVLREVKPPSLEIEEHPPLACLVQFKYAGSLFKGVDPRPAGAIATSEAEVIAVGDEARTIHFV